MVYENEKFIVLTDKYRKTSIGSICLITPKQHKKNILELNEVEENKIFLVIKIISKAMQKAYNCDGIRIWTAINKWFFKKSELSESLNFQLAEKIRSEIS